MPLCFHLENYQNCSESPDQQQKMNWAIEWQISSASWINDSQNYSLENYSRSLHLAFDRYLLCNVWKCFFENSIWLAAKEFNRVWFRILKAAKPVLHKRQKNIFFGTFLTFSLLVLLRLTFWLIKGHPHQKAFFSFLVWAYYIYRLCSGKLNDWSFSGFQSAN